MLDSLPPVFASEAAWPFELNTEQLDRCAEFLNQPGPRTVRIFGSSGSGKSFLVRELMVRAATGHRHDVGVYLDVPAGELEASALFDKLDSILGVRTAASRDSPSFVGRKVARAWAAAKSGRSGRRMAYVYLAARDLIGQIPFAGPFVRAIIPSTPPARIFAPDSPAPLRFLMRRSRSRPVLLVIDNTQFLPFALRELLSSELKQAGPRLRLVLIERVAGKRRVGWNPTVPGAEQLDIELSTATEAEVLSLVREVLPGVPDAEELTATLFRRSEGNLKSVWFQLRLLAARRGDQETGSASYEDVILTLPAIDRAVLAVVVFTVGGLTLATLTSLMQAIDLRLHADAVSDTVSDLVALGLLVVNSESADRIRVEHELIAQVVNEITPEDDKLDLRSQTVTALNRVLGAPGVREDQAVLYDRLLGTVNEHELRQTPSLLAHVVEFIELQTRAERHGYLASICRDSVCWDALDALPHTSIRALLDAVQKCSLFSFGLVATARLRRADGTNESLASIYEAKYLVQLFRYEEASAILERLPETREKRAIQFNIALNLAQDDEAADIAMDVYGDSSTLEGSDDDCVILRNSGHLFEPSIARVLTESALDGFRSRGRRFAAATATNNLGIVDLAAGDSRSAAALFEAARAELEILDSSEIYQPLVNLAALAFLDRDLEVAERRLDSARRAAPGSLLQDQAMLELNQIAIDACRAGGRQPELSARLSAVVEAAKGTRDRRFIDVAAWFEEQVRVSVDAGAPRDPALGQRVGRIRERGTVPLEVFATARVGSAQVEVPFVLSPHWRY